MRRRVISTLVVLGWMGAFANGAAAQNPFNTTDGVVDSNVGAAIADPHGNVKELGPLNGSTTKIGVINTAIPPMLEVTNPNGQVDLGTVWLSTRTAVDGDQWLYFAWNRPDSNTGSGFISIEFQQSGLSATCVYAGVDFTNKNDPETAALIANCNPWRNRQDGDFIITWDQQGNGLAFDDIKKRTFTCTGSAVPYTCTLGPVEDLGSVSAAISVDRFTGEMAINLTDEVFGTTDSCLTFSNVLPGTVTGNSDTADYKDTIFATTPPITNCGVLVVRKRTLNAAGNEFTDPANPAFGYTVTKSGDALRFNSDAANHPVDGSAPQVSIVRPNNNTPAGPSLLAGVANAQTHTDLIPGANYTLVEATPPTPYQLRTIVCTDATGSRTLFDSSGGPTVSTYSVSIPSGTFQFTECVITNQFVRTSPTATTAQIVQVRLSDTLSLTGIVPNASDRPTSVIFRLYNDVGCGSQVGNDVSGTLTYNGAGTTATANMGTTTILVPNSSTGTTWFWRVFYAGDSFNNPVTTGCGAETTTVTVVVNDSGL